MGVRLLITIDGTPPRELNPNYSPLNAMWWAKKDAKADWTKTVYYSAIDTMNRYQGGWAMPEKASLKYTFYYSMKRDRDIDNIVASMKCAQDALVKAGVILADDSEHLTLLTPEIIVDKKRAPLTLIEIEALNE